ncbi:MAG: OprD family porin [Pseudomonas sp.]|uniref:OprD family porin n=1 Tax=Pseudomonas sp. TaxID=306 RepID=UPI003C741B6F
MNKLRFGALVFAGFSTVAHADFFSDSHATVDTRNVYFNRDFRDGPQQSRRDEWAQGLMLKFESGYTPGVVGFGVDLLGMFGARLDSSPDRAGSGLLPVRGDGRAAAQYGKLGVTAKVSVATTELKVGALIPALPTLRPNDGMILPQSFQGALLTSHAVAETLVSVGQLQQAKARNDTGYEDITLNNKNNRFTRNAPGNHLSLAGFDRRLNEQLTFSYHYAQLSDVYSQQFAGLVASQPWGAGKLSADLRFFSSTDQGAARGGPIDNQAFSGMLGYARGAQAFSVGYQRMAGRTAFPYVEGSDAYLINFSQIGDFAEAGERSWQARYDVNFEALGMPGLTVMSRYVRGDDARVSAMPGPGQEWERDTEVKYVIQRGSFKNLALRVRDATYRSSFSRDADEVRVLITYTRLLW